MRKYFLLQKNHGCVRPADYFFVKHLVQCESPVHVHEDDHEHAEVNDPVDTTEHTEDHDTEDTHKNAVIHPHKHDHEHKHAH